MSSLEYIKEKISKKIKTINEKRKFMTNCKIMNIPFNSELTYEDEKELEYLRQVECELEAWEVVKKRNVKIGPVRTSPNFEVYDSIHNEDAPKNCQITKKEYETIVKALEVEDEDNN